MSTKLPFVFVLLLCIPAPSALGQASSFPTLGHIGPSTAEVVGVAIGVGAAIGVGVYFAVPKQKTIEGCVEAVDGANWMTDGKNNERYELVAVMSTLKTGERLKLKGKKHKNKSGNQQFTVTKVVEDKGACSTQSTAP